jgi:hypothetical protein
MPEKTHLRGLGSSLGVFCAALFFELDGRPVSERGVQPLSIVITVQEFLQVLFEILQIAIFLAMDLFLLESLHEALAGGVVIRIRRPAHAGRHVVSAEVGTGNARAYHVLGQVDIVAEILSLKPVCHPFMAVVEPGRVPFGRLGVRILFHDQNCRPLPVPETYRVDFYSLAHSIVAVRGLSRDSVNSPCPHACAGGRAWVRHLAH